MADIPNLAGVATADLVEKIGGSFKASYINWARTMNLLHSHAAGWMPRLVPDPSGDVVHKAPHGAYLMVSFIHTDGTETPAVPQAIMDNKNAAIPYDRITARDVTDTHVRGACKAAAFIFGLAHELWAKMPLESGYQEENKQQEERNDAIDSGAVERSQMEYEALCEKHLDSLVCVRDALAIGDYSSAKEAWNELDNDVKIALWKAPTKGGWFTTKEREQMRSNEWSAAQ